MRPYLMLSTFTLAALTAVTLAPERGHAQANNNQQVPMPQGGFKPPPMAPVKPYKPLAVTPPTVNNDPSFAAFRKQLAGVAEKKDRAGLAKLVVAQGFFWMQDKDMADKHKSGVDNLAQAIDLYAKDGSGWDALVSYADEPTAAPYPDVPNTICAPANPNMDFKAFDALTESTQTSPSEWGYPSKDGLEVRNAAQPNAPVVEKLDMVMVRVLPDSGQDQSGGQSSFMHVATPSGKTGYVGGDALSALGSDEMCYLKDATGWKISGFFGGAGGQQ